MIPSLPINDHCHSFSCWLAARRAGARIHTLNLQRTALAIISRNQPCSHLHRPVHPHESAKISLQPSCPQIVSITGVSKSP
jgi:hypothetical protein